MPLHPLFADRLHLLADDSLSLLQKHQAFGAPLSQYQSPQLLVTDRTIDGPAGPIPVRLYSRADHGGHRKGHVAASPGLVWFHGGSFVFGDLNMTESDVVSRELAHRADAVVMAVDYRLVTESVKFPAPLEDGHAALRWFAKHARHLGVDKKRVFVGGVSAGASLAASVSVMDRDSGQHLVRGQLLNCPFVHTALPAPSAELADKLSELPADLIFGADWAVGRNANLCPDGNLAAAAPHWFPGAVGSHSGLPPTQLINCEFDSLRASGELYGQQLAAAGVPVELSTAPGVPHAHLNRLPQDCAAVDQTIDDMVAFLTREH